jgi:hypothetical protein
MWATDAIKQVLERFGLYEPPKRIELHGVDVRIPQSTYDWESWLDEELQRYEKYGMLDGLEKIRMKSSKSLGGMYTPDDCCIMMNSNLHLYQYLGNTVSNDRSDTLLHELIHHVHMTQNDFEIGHRAVPSHIEEDVRNHVSEYATSSIYELVAETGVAIVNGEELPAEIHDIYESYYGPEVVYELRDGE